MNPLTDLAAEVKFRERMRGYDYEEVDNYVKTVSRVAAQAGERIAELEHRLARSESQDSNDEGAAEIRETLLRTLVLAQRTADSAVSEARSEAQSITDSATERAAKTVSEAETAANERLRSAEERAARILSESEENGRIIIAEAKRTAAAELTFEREQAQAELRDLETTRSGLESAVAEIQARLDSERDMLRSLAASFQSFVEKFEPADNEPAENVVGDAAGALDAPGTLDAAGDRGVPPEADDGGAVDAGNDPGAAADPEPPEGSALDFPPAGEETAREPGDAIEAAIEAVRAPDAPDTESVPEAPVAAWGDEDTGIAHSAPGGEAPEKDRTPADVVRPQRPSGGNGASHQQRHGARAASGAAPAGPATMPFRVDSPEPTARYADRTRPEPATMPFGVDSPELFDVDAEEDHEFIEQLRQVVSSDATLPDNDAAMAAFFDHDEGARP